ncbi:hypothetical protein [Fischerella thermalis]|uniref:hypothetical protein n=1 Tax=Fischerella thermalis TaxID=372787 RepID=UPI000313176C|nr:hypothetical protein [Fischerella thermalis]
MPSIPAGTSIEPVIALDSDGPWLLLPITNYRTLYFVVWRNCDRYHKFGKITVK